MHYFSSNTHNQSTSAWYKRGVVALVVVLIMGVFSVGVLARLQGSTIGFEPTIIHIPQGYSVAEIADELVEEEVIQNGRLFVWWWKIAHRKDTAQAGDYAFDIYEPLPRIAERISKGDYGDTEIDILVQEGYTVEDIADVLTEKLYEFDREQFIEIAEGYEGYLFPDTYVFFPSATPQHVFDTMRARFDEVFATLTEDIARSGRSPEDIVIMASIIEREAYGRRDSATISGILWNRINRGMLLQVDASFVYFLGKGSAQLTLSDLAIDHPYNTYVHKGLPPGPISNPGLVALRAALYPERTNYLFYLHDSSGIAHYATTHDGHVANKRNYLR